MDTKYLWKRHNTYWVRVRVPDAVRHLIGKAELSKNLYTKDLAEANRLKHREVSRLKKQIDLAKKRLDGSTNPPSKEEILREFASSMRDLQENAIDADLDDKEVATLFERNDLISSSVVDKDGKLIGRITIDDVVDVIREDADQNLLGMAGVAEDTFAPPGRAAKSRVFWLSMNLVTAFIAASTINLFQDVIDKIVYLAILMPIVASMGGVAATQTLTIVLRGLTLEQINTSNIRWLFKRELAVSILNGIVLSILVGFVTLSWFKDITIAILISCALVINLISSVIAGILVPLILRKFNQDPAIGGSVVVTTVTDVVGFVSFLGLATIYLI